MPVESFKRQAIAPGWTKVTIVARQPTHLPDYECTGLEANIRICKYVLATVAGLFDAAGMPKLSRAVQLGEQRIMGMFDGSVEQPAEAPDPEPHQ